MEETGKCLTCGSPVKEGTPVCPQCGAQLVGPVPSATADKFLRAADKLQRVGKGMQDAGRSLTCGCLSLVVLAILIFVLVSVIRS
jgi:hypothetical protein